VRPPAPERPQLRGSGGDAGSDSPGPLRVVRVDPGDGATGVFRDVPVVLRLSHPAAAESLSLETLRVEDEKGPVPGRPRVSPDGRVLMWFPDRLLAPGERHRVSAAGLRDARGRELEPHESRFVPGELAWNDVTG